MAGLSRGKGGIDGLLARSDGYSGGDWTDHAYYYADAGGNITSMLAVDNTVVASYRYDPYGALISSSGSLADANVYRFSSKEFHASSGLYFYGLRFYDPNLQRWVNQDPIGEAGGINLYGFVGNGPINGVDPYGLSWLGDQLSQVFQGIYDAMMGPQPGVYNPNAKGALDADAGLVDIDRNNNALRGSMAEAGKLAGDALTEAAKYYAAGKAAGIAGAVGCRTIKGLKNLVGAAESDARMVPQIAQQAQGKPIMTQWGWQNTPAWKGAASEIGTAGHNATLLDVGGKIPTQAEAVHMIESEGGTVVRIEAAHPEGGVSTHTFPHINYQTASGNRATVRIQAVGD
jgi:RHS repeat-associated protein